MSRLDELPPDQRATLSLLLGQRKRYAEVARMLGITEQAVHDRAHAALAVLAPRQARELTPLARQEIGDYLLSQQPGVAERLSSRGRIASSAPRRAWAKALAEALAPLADGELPEIPPAAADSVEQPGEPSATATPATPAAVAASRTPPAPAPARATATPAGGSPRSSRLGGALLLAVLVAAIVVGVVLLTGGSGSHNKGSAGATGAKSKTGPTVSPTLALHSPETGSTSTGAVVVLSEKGKRAFYVEATHLPATHGFFYAIWLYNSPSSSLALSRAPAVGSNHKLAGGAPLPNNAGEYREILITRETSSRPTKPGHIVLRGAFSLSG
jgi:hypothetical protein